MKAAILLIEGTNCEDDAVTAFEKVGVEAEKIHLKQLTGECADEMKRNLQDYDILFLPGGWSAGDYVRAGAIFAARLKSKLGAELQKFIDDDKIIVGVCNGFQILVEAGFLPGFDGTSEHPQAVLAINANSKFQCRPTYIKHTNKSRITSDIPVGEIMQIPVAHAEGRLTFADKNEEMYALLEKNGQIAFIYCDAKGNPANQKFPTNPNGSLKDIAGITNPKGNILGMMPHPERAIESTQMADWTRKKYTEGDGKKIIQTIKNNAKK